MVNSAYNCQGLSILNILWIERVLSPDRVAQWIRRWSTEPEILGSIPSMVVILFLYFEALLLAGFFLFLVCLLGIGEPRDFCG